MVYTRCEFWRKAHEDSVRISQGLDGDQFTWNHTYDVNDHPSNIIMKLREWDISESIIIIPLF